MISDYTSNEFINKIKNARHENHLVNIIKKYKGSVHSCIYNCHPRYFTTSFISRLINENLIDVDEESAIYKDIFPFTFTFRQLIEHFSQDPDDILHYDILKVINELKPKYTVEMMIEKAKNIRHANHLYNSIKKYSEFVDIYLEYADPKYKTPELMRRLEEEKLIYVPLIINEEGLRLIEQIQNDEYFNRDYLTSIVEEKKEDSDDFLDASDFSDISDISIYSDESISFDDCDFSDIE